MASNNDFMMQLAAALNVAKSKKQINSDIKQLEKTVNLMRLTATLLKGDTKKQIKEQINQIQAQLAPVKLAAKLDEKQAQQAVNNALKNVKFSDININIDGLNLKLRKTLSSINSHIPKMIIPVDYEIKKQRLQNDLTTYLTKNSKIRESSGLLNEADNLKALFDKINDKKSLTEATERFRLYKSEVLATGYAGISTTDKLKGMLGKITQISSAFGLGALVVRNYVKALGTLKENSTLLVEIQKTSEATAKQIKEIANGSFSIASKYGVLSKDFLTAYREMSRAGFEKENSQAMAELSVLAKSAGDMTADLSNDYLIASNAAYGYQGNVKKLNGLLDSQNQVTNRNAVSMQELAEATKVAANQLSNANIKENEMTALLGTGIATTRESGSVVGRAVKAIIMNLQQVKNTDEGFETTEEDLSKVEKALDKVGISLKYMEDGILRLRNPMEVLDELSQKFNALPKDAAERADIISSVGGKYRSNVLSSILSNWNTTYQKMLGDYENAQGSAMREAEKTANSWEGKINGLQNQWDSFVNHVTDQDTIKGGISFLDNMIFAAEKLVDTLGAIPTLLTTVTGAYTLLNKDYGITQITNPQSGKLDVQGNYMGINITALKAQKKHFSEAEAAIAQWNKQVVVGLNDINDFEVSVVKNNTQLKEYLATCTDGSASLAGYRASLKAAGVQTEALRLKTVLMTSAMSFGLGLAIQTGISLLTKVIDEQVHAQERALEAAQEAGSRIKSINDTYASHRKVVEDTASAYEELSKGVDTATNRNISLGTEDYNKFLDINKQLAEAFPELITTIDQNGNAIINLGTHGRSASEDLRELLSAEEDLQNFKISQELTDVFGGVKVQVDNALKNQEEYNMELEKTQEVLKDIRNMAAGKISIGDSIDFTGDFMNEGDANKHNAYISAIQKFYKQLTPERRIDIGEMLDTSKIVQMNPDGTSFRFYLDTVSLSNEEKQTLTNLIQEQSQDIAISLSDSVGTSMQKQAEKTKEAELAWKDFIPSLVATMKSKATFKELDETTQQIALHMVEGLQMDVADQMDKNNPYEYIRNSIIAPLTALSDEDLSKVSDAYEKLFSLDSDKLSLDDTKKQVDGYIKTIADILGKDPIKLKIQFGFNNIDSLVQNYSTIMQKAAEKFSGQTALSLIKGGGEKYETEFDELDKFAKANSINTQNEIAFWNKCLEESKTRQEAMRKYLANSNIVNQRTNLTFFDTFDKLEEMTEPLKALDEAYSNFIDKDKEITFDNLAALSDKFKGVSGIQNYIKAIQDAKGNTEATQEAFNNLTSAYIEHTGILDQVNQSNTSLIQSYLQEQGIANADILVQQALSHNLAVVEAQKYLTANASFDLADATSDEIAAFINSAEAADVSKAALIELMMSKISCNETGIVTDGDIQNLIDLATAAGIAEAAIKNAKAAQNQKNAPGVARSAGAENAISESIYGNLESEIKAELYKPREYKFTGGSASNKARGGGSGGSKDKTKEPTIFDFMQNKVDKLDNTIEQLQDQVDTFISSVDKNNTTDTIVDQMIEKMSILQQMHDKYMEEAAKVGLAQEYIDKIQNGTMNQDAIERISDENLVKQIQEYEKWYKSATDTNDKIVETRKNIEKLNLSKLDNIKNQFDNILGAQNDLIDAQKQYLDLRESMGEEIYADDYADLIDLQGELVNKNAEAYNRLANEMSKINLEKGSDEWYKYNEELQKYKNNMMSAASAVKEYMNAIVELEFKGLTDFKSQMDSISNTISTMSDLIGNVGLTDEKGKLTDLGLTKMALYAQQLANSKQEAAEYAEAMNALKDMLDEGLLTQDEYNKRLQDYTSAQNSAVQSTKEAKDAILSLVKDGIQAEIDAKKKLVDETKAALDAERDLHDYQNSISEKQDSISKLERQIAALSNSTNREDIAQRLQLQSQLAEAKKELYELQYDHEIDQRKEALDKEFNDYEENKQKESDELDSNLDAQNAAIEKYLNEVKTKYSTVYGVLNQYGDEYSLAAIEDLTTPWNEGGNAADLCSVAVGDALSNIQYNIDSMDFSRLYEMVDLFNSLGMSNGIGSSGGGDFEDVTDQGRWQKGKGGKWWYGNSNDDYVSGDIYTINGKQYGFDDDGYMVTGWRDDFGDWRYFEPENGEMVKSQWRKSKDGDWYYLDKDGVMATDMAVKSRDGDGYYYLDKNGKYDGKPLSAEQVRKLGYTIGYKKGTKRISHDQLAWTQENKPELITRPSDGALLTPLKLGDGVINGDLTQNLLDIAGNPNRFVEDIVARSMPNYKIPDYEIHPVNREQKIEVNMNIGGVLDEAAARVLSERMPEMLKKNHMQITNQVWKDTRYGMKGK